MPSDRAIPPMARRFQFSLKALMGLLTLAALTAWVTTLFGPADIVIALFLASPAVAGVRFHRPLEGFMLNAILLFIVGGFVVAGLLMD